MGMASQQAMTTIEETTGPATSDLPPAEEGRSVPMVDSVARVTGAVGYTEELEVPGMVHARILRSPFAHARVIRVDASRAEKLAGVVAVLTREDLIRAGLGVKYGPYIRDRSVVANRQGEVCR